MKRQFEDTFDTQDQINVMLLSNLKILEMVACRILQLLPFTKNVELKDEGVSVHQKLLGLCMEAKVVSLPGHSYFPPKRHHAPHSSFIIEMSFKTFLLATVSWPALIITSS